MAFKDNILTFEDSKILTDDGLEVMMDWEAPKWKNALNTSVTIAVMFLK